MEEKHHTIERLTNETHAIRKMLANRRRAVFERFPFLFMFLGAFGLVTTFYGFEHIIDRIPFLVENPVAMLLTGVITLALTGTLYKKLQ